MSAVVRCRDCGGTFGLAADAPPCPSCGSDDMHVVATAPNPSGPGVEGVRSFLQRVRQARVIAARANSRKRIDDPAAVDALKPRPVRKVSEVVAELAGLWGLDSDDAAAVICNLADKIRAQAPVSGAAPPTANAGSAGAPKPSDPE